MRDSSAGWLSTREAAELLRVSEASVRRWSDRGVLPVRRVGRRRERRYRVDDVRQFARRQQARGPAPEPSASRVLLGGLPVEAPSHLAALYDGDAGPLRLSLPFLVDGLRSAQPCVLVAKGELLDRYLEALRPEIDVDQALASGLLSVADGPGRTQEEALEFWEERCWAALAKGSSVIRAVAEMSSAREGFVSEREMLAFESAVNLTFRRFPIVALCQYDVDTFSGGALMAALKAHPDLFALPLGRFLN